MIFTYSIHKIQTKEKKNSIWSLCLGGSWGRERKQIERIKKKSNDPLYFHLIKICASNLGKKIILHELKK